MAAIDFREQFERAARGWAALHPIPDDVEVVGRPPTQRNRAGLAAVGPKVLGGFRRKRGGRHHQRRGLGGEASIRRIGADPIEPGDAVLARLVFAMNRFAIGCSRNGWVLWNGFPVEVDRREAPGDSCQPFEMAVAIGCALDHVAVDIAHQQRLPFQGNHAQFSAESAQSFRSLEVGGRIYGEFRHTRRGLTFDSGQPPEVQRAPRQRQPQCDRAGSPMFANTRHGSALSARDFGFRPQPLQVLELAHSALRIRLSAFIARVDE